MVISYIWPSILTLIPESGPAKNISHHSAMNNGSKRPGINTYPSKNPALTKKTEKENFSAEIPSN